MNNIDRVNKFRNEKIAIHCETEEEAKSFVKWCFNNGMKWTYHTKDTTFFGEYENETCYIFNFNGDERVGYCDKQFYEEEGCEIINFKDFMKEENKMTNLEYVVSKNLFDEGNTLCYIAYICKYGVECGVKECSKCEFNKDIDLCVQVLLQEHKEPVKLKQWEYDLIMIEIDRYGCGANTFGLVSILKEFKEKGCFKGVYDVSMTLQEILDNCEVVE